MKFDLPEDLLKRSEEADSLQNYLLKRYEQIPLKPFTLNINAEWGYGKTYFLQQLANKCGISRVTLGKVERGELGNTSVKTLDIILASLGLEIEFKTIRGFGLPNLDEL